MKKLDDFFGLEASLADDERMAMQSVREFVQAEVKPIIAECFERAEFPKQLINKLGQLGVLGANLPTEYGCAGMNNVAYGLVMQELEAGDSGVRSFASVQGALCMYPIYAFGSEQQRQRYLPGMAEAKIIGCFGLTEPNFGSTRIASPMIGISRFTRGRRTNLPMAQFQRGSSGCTATAVSPSMVSGRVVATVRKELLVAGCWLLAPPPWPSPGVPGEGEASTIGYAICHKLVFTVSW